MPYTDVFGGSTVQPSDVQFSEITIAASILTYWPAFATTGQVMSRIMKVNASVPALTISMPDATLTGGGQDVLFDNSGANTFTVLGFTGSVIATVAPGQVKYIYLSDASTSAGTWRVTIFGVGSSNLDAAALSGYGLKAITSTINTAAVATDISGNTTVVAADRSKVFVWTGGSGTLTLPTTVGSTSDFAIEVRNQGTGTLTLAPVGGVLIDASATITLSVQESCFVHMGATDWYTVGRGRNTAFNFTQLTKATTGGTTVLTLTEASNVVQKYTGALVSNATITLPAVVQVYYVNNATTGTYTLTFGCSGGGTSIAVVQSQAAILFCDGVNIVNANTSLSSGISSIIFAAGTVTAPPVAIAESVTGFYASGTHEIGVSINGVAIGKFTSSGITMDATNLTNTIAPQTHAATSKPTPVDADELPLSDSAATFGLKKLTWANVKATLAAWLNSTAIPASFTTVTAGGQVLSLALSGSVKAASSTDPTYSVEWRANYSDPNAAEMYVRNTLRMRAATNGGLRVYDLAGTERADFTSSGLAVTGSVSTVSSAETVMRVSSSTNTAWRGYVMGIAADATTEYASSKFEGEGGEYRHSAGFTGWGGIQTFYTNGVRRATLDSAGNLGLGVPPSAWGSLFKPIELGNGGSFITGRTDALSQVQVGANAWFNGTNWIYKNGTGGSPVAASKYYQISGAHYWEAAAPGTAGNPISFTQAMTLAADSSLTVAGEKMFAQYGGSLNASGGAYITILDASTLGNDCHGEVFVRTSENSVNQSAYRIAFVVNSAGTASFTTVTGGALNTIAGPVVGSGYGQATFQQSGNALQARGLIGVNIYYATIRRY
jgi:hypothetical protein